MSCLHIVSHLWAQGSGESSSQAYWIRGKAGWMCVERDWESRPSGSEENVVFGAQRR